LFKQQSFEEDIILLKNYLIDKMYKAKYRHSRNKDKLKQM